MKILFDSERQKEAFIRAMIKGFCPNELYLKDQCKCSIFNANGNCEKCWENCGIEVEVKK